MNPDRMNKKSKKNTHKFAWISQLSITVRTGNGNIWKYLYRCAYKPSKIGYLRLQIRFWYTSYLISFLFSSPTLITMNSPSCHVDCMSLSLCCCTIVKYHRGQSVGDHLREELRKWYEFQLQISFVNISTPYETGISLVLSTPTAGAGNCRLSPEIFAHSDHLRKTQTSTEFRL